MSKLSANACDDCKAGRYVGYDHPKCVAIPVILVHHEDHVPTTRHDGYLVWNGDGGVTELSKDFPGAWARWVADDTPENRRLSVSGYTTESGLTVGAKAPVGPGAHRRRSHASKRSSLEALVSEVVIKATIEHTPGLRDRSAKHSTRERSRARSSGDTERDAGRTNMTALTVDWIVDEYEREHGLVKDKEKIMRYADSHCKYTETFENGQHYYTYTGPCFATGKPYSVKIKGEDLFRYRHGALIQDAFRDMPAGDREFLMSGYSPEGWASIFGNGETDEEDSTGLCWPSSMSGNANVARSSRTNQSDTLR